ncbi:hypothetical protein DBR32_04515 [Taibaiella sp. KBW10]|nr:hypothetical protein DBR32_04515 [Taibaiella sp. KBW10]
MLAASTIGYSAMAQQKPYFQQKVDTKIEVSLDDVKHFLHGSITLQYTNNAPDTLSYIYFHLYPNAYSSDKTAYVKQSVENGSTAHYLAKKEDWGYIDSLKFMVNDMPAKMVTTDDADIVKILLPQPILPGMTASISTPFRVKIPKTFSRMGHEGQSYQISQWFPKPAVYDKTGWHPYPYLDQGEFYSEYGHYDVSITLPQNYVVMATGNLETPEEEQWLDELSKKEWPKSAKEDSTLTKRIPSSTTLKTIRYTEDNIHDFAWFADKKWVVRKDTVQVPGSGLVSTIYTAFKPTNASGWRKSTLSVKTAVLKYSELVGPYPYKTVKAVEGSLRAGGGMEYPTVTVIAPGYDVDLNHTVIIHEVGHNWFYGILGSNERMYPWMDEGVNSYYENIVTALPFSDKPKSVYSKLESLTKNLGFTIPMSMHIDQALELPAYEYTANGYGGDVYGKTAAYLVLLKEYMGEASFNAAMQDYFTTWKYKHPQPEDFKAIFKKHTDTDKDIDWFFTDALHSAKGVDFSISKPKWITSDGARMVTLKNKTGIMLPLALQVDSNKELYWINPIQGKTKFGLIEHYRKISVASFIPDYNVSNNVGTKGFRMKPFLGWEATGKQTTWVLPAIGYNVYDRFMLGGLFHNMTLPEKSFQYALAPMYGFGSKTLVGTGMVSKAWYPQSSWLQELDLNIEGKRFSYRRTMLDNIDNPEAQYLKVAPEVRFVFKKPYARSTLNRYLSFKGYYIQEGQYRFDLNPADSLYYPSKAGYSTNVYGRVQFGLEQKRTFNPYSLLLEAQVGKTFAKFSAEGNLKIDYFYKKKAVYLRGFAGKMVNFNGSALDNRRYSFNATYSGWNDYLYDQTFIGRNMQTGLAAQQIYLKEGGMKMPTLMYSNPIGLTNDWMAALNLKIDLPIGLPIQIFADFMTFAKAKEVNPNQSRFLYDAGITVKLTPYLDVNLPILMSPEYTEYKTSILGKNAFGKTITFNVNLDKLYWPRLQRGLGLF